MSPAGPASDACWSLDRCTFDSDSVVGSLLTLRAHSTITALEALNYTVLYAYGAMDALTIYQHLPDLVQIVIFEGSQLDRCIERNNTNWADTEDYYTPGDWQDRNRRGCIKKKGFGEGIPIWKTFVFHFWAGPATPMGSGWTLAPEDWALWSHGVGNQFLGELLSGPAHHDPPRFTP